MSKTANHTQKAHGSEDPFEKVQSAILQRLALLEQNLQDKLAEHAEQIIVTVQEIAVNFDEIPATQQGGVLEPGGGSTSSGVREVVVPLTSGQMFAAAALRQAKELKDFCATSTAAVTELALRAGNNERLVASVENLKKRMNEIAGLTEESLAKRGAIPLRNEKTYLTARLSALNRLLPVKAKPRPAGHAAAA